MLQNSKLIIVLLGVFGIAGLWSSDADAQRERRGFERAGTVVRSLPHQHRVISLRGRDYFYSAGAFYERRGGSYVVVRAPIGARVKSLPTGFISFGIGNRRYFHVNATYYLWDESSRDYVVVEAPEGVNAQTVEAESVADVDIYVYPLAGQSEEQRDQDRYECHLWAKDQTGFDPSLSGQDVSMASDYKRAISACLEGREYTVK